MKYLWFAAVLGIGAAIFPVAPLSFQDDTKWSLTEIANFFGVRPPEDATNVVNNSQRGRNAFISLAFDASPESVFDFTQQICGGVLHEGYDPFEAIDTIDPPHSANLIKMRNFTYYSYSQNVSAKILGNRCWNDYLGTIQIRIDTTNDSLYHLQFVTLSDPSECADVPCRYIGINFIRPIDGITPFIVIGMHEQEGKYFLLTDEVCVETQTDYELYDTPWIDTAHWAYLIGSDVSIEIDNTDVLDAYIHDWGMLAPHGFERSQSYYHSCFNVNLEAGKHTMAVNIETVKGSEFFYSWDFYVKS